MTIHKIILDTIHEHIGHDIAELDYALADAIEHNLATAGYLDRHRDVAALTDRITELARENSALRGEIRQWHHEHAAA